MSTSVSDAQWYEETRREQLAMNPRTWAALQEHGVDETTLVTLDFFYDAPTEEAARALADFILDETDHTATVSGTKNRLTRKTRWSVSGSTEPTAISLEILNEWVDWMVAAGADYGGCKFDGWGAQVP